MIGRALVKGNPDLRRARQAAAWPYRVPESFAYGHWLLQGYITPVSALNIEKFETAHLATFVKIRLYLEDVNRDSPDDSRTGVNIRAFPALQQD
jgi:hypothetical protein